MKRAVIAAGLVACIMSVDRLPLAAAAWKTCNGVPVRPFFQSINWHVAGCSFPTLDVPEGRSVARAVAEMKAYWKWGVTASVPVPEPCVIHKHDGRWDVALADAGQIDGAAGTTFKTTDGCTFSWEERHITEANVIIAVDQDFNDPNGESFLKNGFTDPGAGRVAMLHEFGHAFGLEHSSQFSVMRPTADDIPLGGANQSGSHVYFFGDDSAGLTNLIGYPGGYPNAYATAQFLRSGVLANVHENPSTNAEHPTPLTVSAGQSVSFRFSVGTTYWYSRVPFDVRIYADDPGVCTSLNGVGTELARLRGSVAKFSTVSQVVAVTIPPSIPRNRTLQVFVGIDPGNALFNNPNSLEKEARGWDNCVATALKLKANP